MNRDFAVQPSGLRSIAVRALIWLMAMMPWPYVSSATAQTGPTTNTSVTLAQQLKQDAGALLKPQASCASLVSAHELLGATLFYANQGNLSAEFKTAIAGERAKIAKRHSDGGCGGMTSLSGAGGIGRNRLIPLPPAPGGGGGVTWRNIPEFMIAYSLLDAADQAKVDNVLSAETLAEVNAYKSDATVPGTLRLNTALDLLKTDNLKDDWLRVSRSPTTLQSSALKAELDRLRSSLSKPAGIDKARGPQR